MFLLPAMKRRKKMGKREIASFRVVAAIVFKRGVEGACLDFLCL